MATDSLPVIDDGAVARLNRVWHDFVDQGRIVGGVLLVAHHGELRYASARGWANREQHIPVTRQTRFRLASLSKLVTSISVLQLCDAGRLALDAPVTDWLPDFRPRLAHASVATISLRQLLSHTAGLSYGFEQPAGNAYQRAGVSDGLDHVTFDQALNLQRLASVPLLFEPGRAWGYSLATDVLGRVIERASGLTLAHAIARGVSEPLGLQATGFADTGDQCLASAYRDGQAGPVLIGAASVFKLDGGQARLSATRATDSQAYASGGAGLLGTADDYLRVLECLRLGGAPLLSRAGCASLLNNAIGELQIKGRGPGWKFGLGPLLLTDPVQAGQQQGAGTWSWCGLYGCHYWVDPLAGISLVALTNTAVTGAWGAFADGLVEAIYGVHPTRAHARVNCLR